MRAKWSPAVRGRLASPWDAASLNAGAAVLDSNACSTTSSSSALLLALHDAGTAPMMLASALSCANCSGSSPAARRQCASRTNGLKLRPQITQLHRSCLLLESNVTFSKGLGDKQHELACML